MATLRFRPGGRVLAVWDDGLAEFFERAFSPEFIKARRRVSVIETVEEGPYAGCFYASMERLADLTKDDRHRLTLWPPQRLEADCKKQEREYLERALLRPALGQI